MGQKAYWKTCWLEITELVKEQVQKARKEPTRIHLKKHIPSHSIAACDNKPTILEVAREKRRVVSNKTTSEDSDGVLSRAGGSVLVSRYRKKGLSGIRSG